MGHLAEAKTKGKLTLQAGQWRSSGEGVVFTTCHGFTDHSVGEYQGELWM